MTVYPHYVNELSFFVKLPAHLISWVVFQELILYRKTQVSGRENKTKEQLKIFDELCSKLKLCLNAKMSYQELNWIELRDKFQQPKP